MDTQSKPSVLFVDDEPLMLRSLKQVLKGDQYTVFTAETPQRGLELLSEHNIDVVVSDKMMPMMSGTEFLAQVSELYPDTARIMLTGYTEIDDLIDAINAGRIWGYLQKPWDPNELRLTIEQALQTKLLVAERNMLRASLNRYDHDRRTQFQDFVGDSMAMQVVYKSIEKAAPSQANVFITGPSGSGKELAASAIHALSPRKNKQLICLNCAAIPNELMESEIFGHVKGAFSGAVANRDGAATLAHGGTLFLDEIGEMDMSLQAKILRFVQTGTFQRVGSGKLEKVDVRFVCATNREPLVAISEQRLREDLFYRLNVISIDMPALAERDQDPLQIALNFLNKFSELENKMFVGFTTKAQALILSYPWPGNVRQLENLIHSAVVMSDGPLVDADIIIQQLKLSPDEITTNHDLESEAVVEAIEVPQETPKPEVNTHDHEPHSIKPLAEVERHIIEQAIKACDDNVVKAAGLLEVSPSTLYRKIQQWDSA